MATQIKLRRDTAQNWTTSNPVLALGEPGIETDTYKFKFGDGQTAWSNLAYYGSDFATTTFVNNAISNVVGAAPDLLNTLQELSSAINTDPSFFSTINNQLANKANVADIPSLNGYATESFVANAVGQIPGSDWANIADKPTFSTVATTGSYNDLADLPSYSLVATTGSYNDLINVPIIPSITGLATESFVSNAIANVVNSAPALLDTLNELANAIGNDSSFTTTITNQLANKANVSDIPSISGLATETFVSNAIANISASNSTGNITFDNNTLTGTGDIKLHFTPSASPAVEFNFASNGTLTLPGGIVVENNSIKNTNSLSGEVQITTATTQGDTEKNWKFNHNGAGALIVPEGSSVQAKFNFNITATETGFIKFTNIVDFDTNSSVDDNQINIVNPEASILDLIDPTSANYAGGLGSVVRIVYGPFLSAEGTIIEAFANPGTPDPFTGLPRYQGRISIVNPRNGDLLKEFTIENSVNWKFGSDGKLTLPLGGDIVDSTGNSVLGGGTANIGDFVFTGSTMTVTGDTNEDIFVKALDDLYLDALDDDIFLRARDDIRFRTGYNFSDDTYSWEMRYNDSGVVTFYKSSEGNDYGFIQPVNNEGALGISFEGNDDAYIKTGYGDRTWKFDSNGHLTLPAGGDIKDSTGNSVLGGSGATALSGLSDVSLEGPIEGSVLTWNSSQNHWENRDIPSVSTITNTDGIDTYSVNVNTNGVVTMTTARGGIEFGAQPEPGGPTHLHIMRPAGENGSSDLYFGDDYNYVKLPGLHGSNPNTQQGVEIGSSLNEGTVHKWKFDTDGNLTLPLGGTVAEGTSPTGVGKTITLKPDGGSATQALLIYPTGGVTEGDHIHLTAGGGDTELYLGNDYHYVKLVNGGNVQIQAATTNLSATAAWNFSTDGGLTFPDSSKVSEVIPATGAAASVVVIAGASSISNEFFVSLPPPPINNYSVPSTDIIVDVTWIPIGPTFYAPIITVVDGGTGHTGGGEFSGGEVLSIPYADMGITFQTGSWTWYVNDLASNFVLEAGLNEWTFGGNGALTFPDTTVQTTASVQGEQIFTVDTGVTAYAPTVVDFNLLFVTSAIGYSETDPISVTLPNGVPGQRLVIFNGYNLATLTVNPGPVGRDISSGIVAEFIYSGFDGLWMPLYGTNSPT
jgi:hypothetical protein